MSGSGVENLVPQAPLITGCQLYPNTSRTCGWIAASILIRYWHARSGVDLIPARFAQGSDLRRSPDFSEHLRASARNASWARPVSAAITANARAQRVPHVSRWLPGSLGLQVALDAGRPVILFGYLPLQNRRGNHAIVVYGRAASGRLIAHYGWKGYERVELPWLIPGSVSHFQVL